MLVKKSTDHPYYIFPYSISGDFVKAVKVLSRKLLMPHPELECLGVLNNVFSASKLRRVIYELLSRFPNIPSFHFSHNTNMDALLLETCSSLQRLDVSFNRLGNKGAEAIASILKQRSLLLELNIASNHIGSGGAKSLAEALKTCTNLEKLVLHSNDIRTEGVQALAKSMEHWTNFTSLDVSSNSLTSEAAEILAIGLKKCPSHTFQEMRIGNNEIRDSGLKCLASPNLLSIDFSHNYLGDSVLLEACSSLCLQELDVSYNSLGTKGAETIAIILKQCSLLLELNIASNHIGSDGAKALAEALRTCIKLEKLVLHSNDIRTEGVQALANSMEHWKNFASLDVSSNSLTSEAAKVLAIGLKKCPSHTFQEMRIGNNAIGDSGLESLASALIKCTTLDISSNVISVSGLKAVAGNLKSIQQLDISGNILDCVDHEVIFAKCASIGKLTIGRITDPEQLMPCSKSFETLARNLKYCMQLCELNVSHTPLATSLVTLSHSLSCLSQLTTLSLSFTQIEPEGTELLSNGLISCKNLRKLFIDNNNIGNIGAVAIANVIGRCHQLQVLDVSSNNIRYSGALSLAQALKKIGNLRELNISLNNIKSAGERLLCEALEHCVNINSLNFSMSSLVHLPVSLKSFIYLQNLQISDNSVNSHDLKDGLKCCKNLQELYISSCEIDSLGANEVISSLSKTCCVLDISSNNIESLAFVLTHMQDHSSLSHLNFSMNSETLLYAFSFSKCAKLQTLDISDTSLGDTKLSLLSKFSGLQRCTFLQHLYIARNIFTIRGLKALAGIFQYFPMLQTLDVSGNNIGDEGAEILADSLQNNPILATLGVHDCGISQTGVRALDTALNSDTGRVRTRIEHTHRLPPSAFPPYTFR